MKGVPDVVTAVRRHVLARWADEVVADISGAERWWPRRYPLGRPDEEMLTGRFDEVVDLSDQVRRWAAAEGFEVVDRRVRAGGVTVPLPSHVIVPDLDAAACAADAVDLVDAGRARAAVIDAAFPHRRDVLARTVAATSGWSMVDVDLLCRAAAWFEGNDAAGLSPREVPLEGFHSKWLESRRGVVATLAGRESLGVLRPHQPRIHFTYLDPAHLAGGGRRHDSATVGDSFAPAYSPAVVVICENKDTAIHFPALEGAIAVEGAGYGAAAFAEFGWLTDAPLVVYWGDMDADGLRILAQFRTAGVPARSIFMDLPAFDRWERFGTNTDKNGAPIPVTGRGGVVPVGLEEHEADLYLALTDPGWGRPRRIEQERIPLEIAAAVVAGWVAREVNASRSA
ncbi:Wadjet anti-phage system protein JetD domain-containing protein [Agromyces sp. LHK192]|uniref:Wadjet anti-phage system protein JetD domain-containing protein n=1 Tax=Agromyces sp. LHK192 TaxID=2498704 RepID=UPI0013E387DE|nr:Wadjet anti-phage system protein JetD domain-containing protein [Agromyces sp. LHK192]